MVASLPGISSFGTRLMAGFGGFTTEPFLLLLVLKGFQTWGLSLSPEVHALCVHLYLHLLPLVVLGIFSSSMTLLHVINLFCHYLAPSGVDTLMICKVYFSIAVYTAYKVIYKKLSIKLSKLNFQLIQLSISRSSL